MKYITIKGFGKWQLANQMFQYLFLKTMSNKTKRKIIFIFKDEKEKDQYLNTKFLKYFDINIEIIHIDDLNKEGDIEIIDIIEKSLYDEELIDKIKTCEKKVINLIGFFQSYKYYDNISKSIKSLYKKTCLKKKYLDLLEQKQKDICFKKTVSIHVRRGDYIKYNQHNLLTIDYFIDAIDYFEKSYDNLNYIIFSDDIEWCERVFFKLKDRCCFSREKDIIDLFLMASCPYNIISNSSFSLIASYLLLNKKQIIGPKMWLDSSLSNNVLDKRVLLF